MHLKSETQPSGAMPMSLSSLKDKLNTGIDSLDYEHRKLVGVMEELCDKYDRAESSVSDLFGTLYSVASAHFALEESIMRERKYASYDAHKADHEQLLDRIRFMMEAYEAGQCADCGTTLRACLEAWLAAHVANADMELRTLAK
jgi:hemerythrin-like metal-binding protein